MLKKKQLKKLNQKKKKYYLHIHSTTLQRIYTLKYSGDLIYSRVAQYLNHSYETKTKRSSAETLELGLKYKSLD